MGFLTRLLGDYGVVRFIAKTADGKSFNGKMIIESFNNSKEEIEEEMKNILFVEKGIKFKEIKIVGYHKK